MDAAVAVASNSLASYNLAPTRSETTVRISGDRQGRAGQGKPVGEKEKK